MIEKPIIETVKVKKLSITLQYVFRASFNDTYWLEEYAIPLEGIDQNELTWFDPYHGRSKQNSTLIALAYCSDDKFIILEKQDGKVTQTETQSPGDCILCEDYDENMLLAAHIRLA